MCQTTPAVASGESAVAAERIHVIHVLTDAGIRPSMLTGFALLDAAVSLLALHDVPLDALHARVTRILADAEVLRLALTGRQQEQS